MTSRLLRVALLVALVGAWLAVPLVHASHTGAVPDRRPRLAAGLSVAVVAVGVRFRADVPDGALPGAVAAGIPVPPESSGLARRPVEPLASRRHATASVPPRAPPRH